MVVPKNAPNKAGAYKYLNAMLQPPAQQAFAEKMGYLPTVENAPLTGKVAEELALPPDLKMIAPDYSITGKLQGADLGLVEEDDEVLTHDRSLPLPPGEGRGEGVSRPSPQPSPRGRGQGLPRALATPRARRAAGGRRGAGPRSSRRRPSSCSSC